MKHHAYYIEDSASRFEAYKTELKPFWASKFERFGVDEARELIALASLKNFNEAVFLISAASITSEAQQALLKLFEEPQEGTTFILLVPHGTLIATLKSRMMMYEKRLPAQKKVLGSPVSAKTAEAGRPDYFSALPAAFLAASGKERSDLIAKMLKDEEGTKERVRDFINALETECVKLHFAQTARGRQALEDIAMARDYIGDRAPSLKMLLEHLALSLPSF